MLLMAELQPMGFDELDFSMVQLQLDQKHDLHAQHHTEMGEKDSGCGYFDPYDDEPQENDLEASIHLRPKKAHKAPVVLQRQENQASKILEDSLLDLKTVDGSAVANKSEQQSTVGDPHGLYLSSEEDASLSGDCEDSDSLVDFHTLPVVDGEDSKPSSPASSRRSQEDIARVVSITSVGKPQIIDIFIRSSVRKRHSLTLDNVTSSLSASTLPKPTRKSTLLNLYPSPSRLSISSTTSSSLIHHSDQSPVPLPPRRSSKLSNLSSLMTTAKISFLSSDPFATHEQQDCDDREASVMPKAPTSMATAGWKIGLGRTMSKARRPSMSRLRVGSMIGVTNPLAAKSNLPRSSIEYEPETHTPVQEEKPEEERTQVKRAAMPMEVTQTSTTHSEGPLRYEDIMKSVIKAPPPPLPSPVKDRKTSLGSKMGMSLGLARRKSGKRRSDRNTG